MSEEKEVKTVRNSSIELIKIFAMIMIVFSHSLPVRGAGKLITIADATTDVQKFIAVIICYLGQVGNAIFVVCSAWFLIESEKIKWKKIVHIIGDYYFMTMLGLIGVIVLGYRITGTDIIKQIFPMTYDNNWFIGCYILMYMIHPLLNKIIKYINKEQHFMICFIGFVLYGIINTIKPGSFFYNCLIGFIILYFMTAYIKLYMKNIAKNMKMNVCIVIIGIIGSIDSFLITNYLGLRVIVFSKMLINGISFMNPFCLLITFGIFNLAKEKIFYNKVINYISGLSLLIYIIHENYFIYTYIRNDVFKYLMDEFSMNDLVLEIAIVSIISIIGAIIIASIYFVLFKKIIAKISDFIAKWIEKVYNLISKKIINLE